MHQHDCFIIFSMFLWMLWSLYLFHVILFFFSSKNTKLSAKVKPGAVQWSITTLQPVSPATCGLAMWRILLWPRKRNMFWDLLPTWTKIKKLMWLFFTLNLISLSWYSWVPTSKGEALSLLYWFLVHGRLGAAESHIFQTAGELHQGPHSFERKGLFSCQDLPMYSC